MERARLLQRQGLKPGWPDLILMHPAPTDVDGVRQVIVVGLELKTEIGRQSLVQKQVEADFQSAGASYVLARSIDDVHAALVAAGIPTFVTPQGAR